MPPRNSCGATLRERQAYRPAEGAGAGAGAGAGPEPEPEADPEAAAGAAAVAIIMSEQTFRTDIRRRVTSTRARTARVSSPFFQSSIFLWRDAGGKQFERGVVLVDGRVKADREILCNKEITLRRSIPRETYDLLTSTHSCGRSSRDQRRCSGSGPPGGRCTARGIRATGCVGQLQ